MLQVCSVLIRLEVLPGRVLQQIGSFRHNSQKHREQKKKKGFVQGKPLYCKQDKRGWKETLITVLMCPQVIPGLQEKKNSIYTALLETPNWGFSLRVYRHEVFKQPSVLSSPCLACSLPCSSKRMDSYTIPFVLLITVCFPLLPLKEKL